MSLKKIPSTERPRERLELLGADALSLSELIAILLRTGAKGKTSLLLAQELIAHFGGLEGLIDATLEELKTFKGIGPAKAIELKAAFAIAGKNRSPSSNRPLLAPSEVFHLLKDELSAEKQELLVVILKDVRGRVILYETVSIGTLSQVLAHPREIFYPAVRHKAKSLVLVHNHPSGDPTPSNADVDLTKVLVTAGRIMGIHLDDHVIIGKTSFFSFKEKFKELFE
jgi:DNA repair protein RadC